jgi:Cu-Zn family superoxide dismutase
MMMRALNLIVTASLLAISITLSAADTAVATKAFAKVNPTEGQKVTGYVTFEALDKGVHIVADFKGLTPGLHGFHVHEKGDCSSHDGSSAGGHYNPSGKKHGGPDDLDRHAGDFGNVEADANGNAHYERTDLIIKLDGADSIIGKSIVIHADPDDLKSQPSGNSGARIGCGPIEAAK